MRFSLYLILVILFCSLKVSAESREHGGHVHGQGSLSIAFEGAQGSIELDVPGDVIIGFEHEAKTKKDKKAQDRALQKLETEISRMVVFGGELECSFSRKKMELKREGSHSDLEAEFQVSCKKSPLGTKIVFQIQNFFPGFRQVVVQILIDNVQKKIVAKKAGVSVDLK